MWNLFSLQCQTSQWDKTYSIHIHIVRKRFSALVYFVPTTRSFKMTMGKMVVKFTCDQGVQDDVELQNNTHSQFEQNRV